MNDKSSLLAWLVLAIGLALILLFVFDKVDSATGIGGMMLCLLANSIKTKTSAAKSLDARKET